MPVRGAERISFIRHAWRRGNEHCANRHTHADRSASHDRHEDRSLARACDVALVATVAAFASSASASAGTSINTGYFGGVAIEGYDTVAYFTDGQATKGSEQFAYDWLGATWLFRQRRAPRPVRGEAGAIRAAIRRSLRDGTAFGESTANIDPEAWTIVDGKLYLQYSKGAREDVGAGSART